MSLDVSPATAEESVSGGAVGPVNILLVDDEPKNLKALEAILAAEDRRLMCAQSGEDALRWLLKERFAVVLLDVHMPGMDGFDTAALMRQHVRSQSTPIIFLTAAHKEYSHVSRGYSLGAVDYIFKPLDVDILRSKVAVFVDLFRKTEQVRRQAEELTEARGFLESVLQSTRDYAIVVQDPGGTVLAWYEGARQLYGYSAAEMVGKGSVPSLFAPEDAESGALQKLLEEAGKRGRAEGEFHQVRRNGERFIASVSANLRKGADGSVAGYVLVVKDITEQRLQEERARLLIEEQAARVAAEAANERFALLAEASTELGRLLGGGSSLEAVARLVTRELADACIIDLMAGDADIERTAVAHRDAAQEDRLRELSAADLRGSCLGRVLHEGEAILLPEISPRDITELAPDAKQRRALRSFGFTSGIIVPIAGRKGISGAIWLLRTDQNPYGRGDLDFAQDLARRVALALDNLRLYREAQEAVRVRDEFLSVASHELKTPLTSLRGRAQLMVRQIDAGREMDPVRLRRAFEVIDGQSQKLSRLVSQLLDISRLEAGKLVPERSSADVVKLVEAVVESARTTASDQTIELQAPAEASAEVDALRLEQVVTNLLENAIKYGNEGGRVLVEVTTPDADTVHVAVRDWGPGIPEAYRAQIFDRFHQVPSSRGNSGMGLGLYISRQIVELHGGTIEAQFPDDGGTRFVVTLPTREPAPLNADVPVGS